MSITPRLTTDRLITNYWFAFLVLLTLATFSLTGHAAAKLPAETVKISDAWVRSTNPGQAVGAAYMTLTSPKDTALTAVESDASKSVEIHSMSMKNGVMKMRMLETLDLTANKPYALAPGSFHLMLFDLKKPLAEGEVVNFTLHFKNKANVESTQQVQAKVLASSPAESTDVEHAHQH